MKAIIPFVVIVLLILVSCQKELDNNTIIPAPNNFVEYTILKGAQSSDKNPVVSTSYAEQKFKVRFDNSAIYQTKDTSNQQDINKLYGFADNNELHHQYSARFGWYWYADSLHIFAYIYNKGIRTYKEIGTILLNTVNDCSIKVLADKYIFTLNGKALEMPRASTTVKAEGYKLYPYFGGDETAPHTIKVFVKEE